jgi:hypothetical protein
MIVSRLTGGLGNQMFCYAFGKALSVRNNIKKFYIDVSNDGGKSQSRPFLLDKFKLILNTDYFNNKSKPKLIKEKSFDFDSNMLRLKEGYFKGYWQSYKYFEDIRNTLLDDFTLLDRSERLTDLHKTLLDPYNMGDSKSVSVSIRRGDYLSKAHSIHGVLDLSYYYNALSVLENLIGDNITLFVFSDDIKWAIDNFKVDRFDVNYISREYRFDTDGNSISDDCYDDLSIIKECDHNIIANSTFSWWGAWLNTNPNKIVISPKQWFTDTSMNNMTNNLIPKTWIRV